MATSAPSVSVSLSPSHILLTGALILMSFVSLGLFITGRAKDKAHAEYVAAAQTNTALQTQTKKDIAVLTAQNAVLSTQVAGLKTQLTSLQAKSVSVKKTAETESLPIVQRDVNQLLGGSLIAPEDSVRKDDAILNDYPIQVAEVANLTQQLTATSLQLSNEALEYSKEVNAHASDVKTLNLQINDLKKSHRHQLIKVAAIFYGAGVVTGF